MVTDGNGIFSICSILMPTLTLNSKYLETVEWTDTVVRMQPTMNTEAQMVLDRWLSESRVWVRPPKVVNLVNHFRAEGLSSGKHIWNWTVVGLGFCFKSYFNQGLVFPS